MRETSPQVEHELSVLQECIESLLGEVYSHLLSRPRLPMGPTRTMLSTGASTPATPTNKLLTNTSVSTVTRHWAGGAVPLELTRPSTETHTLALCPACVASNMAMRLKSSGSQVGSPLALQTTRITDQ